MDMHKGRDTFERSFLALDELYRSERVFTLQPERVILDDRFRNLHSDTQKLRELIAKNGSQNESAHVDKLEEFDRLISEFIALLEEAGKVHIYSNYRANQ